MKQPELDEEGYFKPIVICPQCGKEYPYYKDYKKRLQECPECGKFLRQTDPTHCRKTCEFCGKPMSPESTLCPHCGEVTKRAQAQTQRIAREAGIPTHPQTRKTKNIKKIKKILEPTPNAQSYRTHVRSEDKNHPRQIGKKTGWAMLFTSGFTIFGLIITAIILMLFL